MTLIETQATLLSQSVSNYEGDLSEALNELGSESFYEAAQCVVEPFGLGDTDDWMEFMDSDPENWVGFVSNVCGSEWGKVAKAVLEYGY